MPSQNKKKSTAAASWKGKKDITSTVELPSGNVCKVKRVSIQKLMSSDVFTDAMTAQIMQQVSEKQGNKTASFDVKVDSMSDMARYISAVDKVTAMIVVEPKVLLHFDQDTDEEIPDEDRDANLLYTDEVDLEDKIFLFNYSVGGDDDLTRFRATTRTALGSVGDVEKVELSSE